ncbi:MAG: hypothetical protein AB2A00_25520 [Myxococcota bacterium]
MNGILLSALVVLAQAPTESTTPVTAERRAALLPVGLPPQPSTELLRASRAVERALAEGLARHSDLKVLRRAEVEALAQQAAQAQLTGCDDESCLARLADALDVDVVLRSQLGLQDGVWDLRVVMLERKTAQASRRTGTQGRSLDALLAGVDGVARELAQGTQFSLQDPRLAERLGAERDVVTGFQASAKVDQPLSRSWTDHVIAMNRESEGLAVLEGALLLAGGVALALGAVLNAPLSTVANTAVYDGAPVGYTRTAPTEGTYTFPVVLTALWLGGSLLVVAGGLMFFAAAGVVALVDGLDLGRRSVSREGCCREEERIREAARPGVGRTVAPVLALGGAAAMLLTAVVAIPAAVVFSSLASGIVPGIVAGPLGTGVAVPLLTYRIIAAALLLSLSLVATVGTTGLALVPLLGAVGLVATRHRELVDDAPVTTTPPGK